MSLIVTVHFTGEASRVDDVLRKDPELAAKLRDAANRHGLRRSTRLLGNGEFLEIDEWDRQEDRLAFLAEMGPTLAEWNLRSGITRMIATTWRSARENEVF